MNAFKQRITDRREAKGLSQRALAEIAGVSEVTYGRYLNLQRTITLSAFMLTCEALGFDPKDLFKTYTCARVLRRVKRYRREKE